MLRAPILVSLLMLSVLAGCIGNGQNKEVDPAVETSTTMAADASIMVDASAYRLEIISSSRSPCPCWEPTVIASEWGLFVSNGNGGQVYRPDNGWQAMPAQIAQDRASGDDFLTERPDGGIYLTYITVDEIPPLEAAVGIPGPAVGIGFQASIDGSSWDHQTTWNSEESQDIAPPMTDRQWLVTGPDGTLYLTYTSTEGVFLSQSDDDGRTWSQFTAIVTPADQRLGLSGVGAPIVLASGEIALATYVQDTSSYTGFFVGTPEAPFEMRPVTYDRMYAPFPQITEIDGTIHMVGQSHESVMYAWSHDEGHTWDGIPLGDGFVPWTDYVSSSPWIDTNEEAVYVMALRPEGPWLARLPAEGGEPEAVWTGDSPLPDDGRTHHAHFDIGPDGMPVLTWTNGDEIFVGALVPEGG